MTVTPVEVAVRAPRMLHTNQLRPGDHVVYMLPDVRYTGTIMRVWPSIEMKVAYALKPSGTPIVHLSGGRRTLPHEAPVLLVRRPGE